MPRGWYHGLVERLEPGERVGEILFGLIMVLTFTLGAGVELAGDREGTRELLVAAVGCNAAWGVIDAALYLMNRLSERGRLHRFVRQVQDARTPEQALGMVACELDDRLPGVVPPDFRAALGQAVLERVRTMEPETTRLTAADAWAGLAVFWLVFLSALPAVIPFVVMRDTQLALRTSNAILLGLLFYVGQRWAAYTGGHRWRTGLLMMALGIAMVVVALALGG